LDPSQFIRKELNFSRHPGFAFFPT
jgi:hypothetical protein